MSSPFPTKKNAANPVEGLKSVSELAELVPPRDDACSESWR